MAQNKSDKAWADLMRERSAKQTGGAGTSPSKPKVSVPDSMKAEVEKVAGRKAPSKKKAPKPKAAPKPPKPKAAPKPKVMPVKGPEGPRAFRTSPTPTASERAVTRYRGASQAAHTRTTTAQPKSATPKPPGRLRQAASTRGAARQTARQARQTAQASRGALGRSVHLLGRGIRGVLRGTAVGLAVTGAVDWGRTGYHYAKGRQAHSGLVKQAGVLKDSGYRVKIKQPTLRRMVRGDIGLTIEKTGKPRTRTVGAAPPRLRRR